MSKTYDKKQDFIQILATKRNNDINEYIKKKKKKPKKVLACRVVKKEENNE